MLLQMLRQKREYVIKFRRDRSPVETDGLHCAGRNPVKYVRLYHFTGQKPYLRGSPPTIEYTTVSNF